MRIRIIPEIASTTEPDVKTMDYNTFNFPEVHFFIATNNWDSIEIYLKQRGIAKGYLSQVVKKTDNVKVKLLEEPDEDMLFLLREIYPSHASNLRKAFFRGEHEVASYLKDIGALIDE